MDITSKVARRRSRVLVRKKRVGPKVSKKRPKVHEYWLPAGLTDIVESHRASLRIAMSLLSSVDAVLERAEDGGSDILDADDPADALVLAARSIADPLDLVRLAIHRVYQAHAGLDSLHLLRAASAHAR